MDNRLIKVAGQSAINQLQYFFWIIEKGKQNKFISGCKCLIGYFQETFHKAVFDTIQSHFVNYLYKMVPVSRPVIIF
jgi:hypothetical protein